MNYDEYKEAYNALNLSGDRLLKGALSLGTEYREFMREPNISEAGDVLCAIMLIDTHYGFGLDVESSKSFRTSKQSLGLILDTQECIKKYNTTGEFHHKMTARAMLILFLESFIGRALSVAPLSEIFEYNINKLKTRI